MRQRWTFAKGRERLLSMKSSAIAGLRCRTSEQRPCLGTAAIGDQPSKASRTGFWPLRQACVAARGPRAGSDAVFGLAQIALPSEVWEDFDGGNISAWTSGAVGRYAKKQKSRSRSWITGAAETKGSEQRGLHSKRKLLIGAYMSQAQNDVWRARAALSCPLRSVIRGAPRDVH